MATLSAVPTPRIGGIDNIPVRAEIRPVATSAKMKGNEKTVNAFATAIPSSPPFHGLLLDDQRPAMRRMIAKTTATRGL